MIQISTNYTNKPFYRRDTLYLEVIVKSVLASIVVALAAGEVVAEVAGGVGAIGSEHRADFVSGVAAGVSHDARPCRWRGTNPSTEPRNRDGQQDLWKTNRRTCGDSDAQVDDPSDEDGQQGSFGDGHLWVL